MRRILLLSAYHTDSHAKWCDGLLREFPDFNWTLLTLPGRHFSWRMRGSALSWLSDPEAASTLSRRYDVILATSMVDLNALIGLYPQLAAAYRILYFHENQFEYPLSPGQKRRAEPLMVSLYSALSADRIVFNSHYNQESFLSGARNFLRRMPERLPASIVDSLAGRATVLPVPVSAPGIDQPAHWAEQREPALLLWNHRWEYDKNPDDFFAACERLSIDGVAFELAVVGQQFRQQPDAFQRAERVLAPHIRYWGFQPAQSYRRILGEALIVVSTAWHEFQGLSVLEAVQSGCIPLVPDRVSYPEIYGPEYRYGHSVADLAAQLGSWLTDTQSIPPVPDTADYFWTHLKPAYRRLLEQF